MTAEDEREDLGSYIGRQAAESGLATCSRETINRNIRDILLGGKRAPDFGSNLSEIVLRPPDPAQTAERVREIVVDVVQGYLKSRGMDPERCPRVESRYEDGKVHLSFTSNDLEVMEVLAESGMMTGARWS